jgi:hypothetical protein
MLTRFLVFRQKATIRGKFNVAKVKENWRAKTQERKNNSKIILNLKITVT